MSSPPRGNTVFDFKHPVFTVPEAHFITDRDGKPCLKMKMGAYDALVPFASLTREFGLEGSPDAALLDLVVSGLKFVKIIRPGDSIPRELLDGTASWRVEEEHLEVARGRLTLQIFGWLTGSERVVTDPIEIMQLVDDPSVVNRVKDGYAKLAEKLELPKGAKEVMDRCDRFARELAYIEALRGRSEMIKNLQTKISAFRRVYRNDRTIDEELVRINNLLLRPINLLARKFSEIDANCGEIIATLSSLPKQITYVREQRDELHAMLMKWDDLLARWQTVKVDVSVASESTIKQLYQFLAQNFLHTTSW